MIFYTMEHRGGLDDSLLTRVLIDKDTFNSLLPYYDFYSFDRRINCVRFILKNMECNLDKPTWLLLKYTIMDVVF